ncbi:MAG: molybdopterin-dependent oxidoreductase [bacterium JZ-2024 1]
MGYSGEGKILKFHATLNGKRVAVSVPEGISLLDTLREHLNITSPKKGCDIGVCGSCVVLVNGEPRESCRMTAAEASGSEIRTVEGLAKDGKLHPVQEGFLLAHGFQCGICTSGFVMSAVALLEKKPKPCLEDIQRALKRNICRCTGYQQIIEAVLYASGQMIPEDFGKGCFKKVKYEAEETKGLPWKSWNFRVVGKPQPQVWGIPRVTGEAKYTADHFIPGMLHGATVRAALPSARILSIDVHEAEQMPGVVRVITWRDIPGENAHGKRIRDQPVLAKDRVRVVGEPVAVVFAETREQALAARDRVRVDYEPLPAVFDPESAMHPEAPKVHERGNILYHYHLEKGDVSLGFAEADVVLERTYETSPQDHAPIEPEAALAYYGEDGKLTVISPGQSVFFDRLNICRALGIPKEDVRCIQPAIGAAYGKREDIYAQIHAALGTFLTGRPVKIEWTREETLLTTSKRTRQKTTLKVGLKKDGTITALKAKVIGDSGAYASWSLNIMRKAGVLVSGPYHIPNVEVDSYAVYTNTPLTGATRGFGAAETNFCSESLMDEAAYAIGMDPLEFRLKNALRKDQRTATDMVMDYTVPLEFCLEEAARDSGWQTIRSLPKEVAPGVFRGIGGAAMWYGIGFGAGIEDTTECIMELHRDGRVTFYVGTVDYGNQSNTTFCMLAAEALGIPLSWVNVINADSDRTPNCGSTVATKQTYTTGNAVVRAALRIRSDILEIASRLLGVPTSDLDIEDGFVYSITQREKRIDVPAIACRFREFGKPNRRSGRFKAHELTTPLDPKTGRGRAWYPLAFGAHIAEVEVDTTSGKVKVKKLTCAHHVGRVLNPASCRGQIVGGATMGLGFALFEDADYGEDGAPRATNFHRYRLPRITDIPDIRVIAIELDERTGPFGAIGVGEPPTIPVAAAIANAVYDAIGVRIRRLPLTPKNVKSALQEVTRETSGRDPAGT